MVDVQPYGTSNSSGGRPSSVVKKGKKKKSYKAKKKFLSKKPETSEMKAALLEERRKALKRQLRDSRKGIGKVLTVVERMELKERVENLHMMIQKYSRRKTVKMRGRFIKNKLGGVCSVKMQRILYEKQRIEKKINAEEEEEKSVKNHVQPKPPCPKQPISKHALLSKILGTLPYSRGKGEIRLRQKIKFLTLQGLVDPSMVHQSVSWWKNYVEEVLAQQKHNPLGKNHPLKKKLKTIALRYAKCRPQSMKVALGQHPKLCWPYQNVKLSSSMEKMNAKAVVKHIEKNTKQFGKIEHLFEGHFRKSCSLYGWPVHNLLILLEQLESNRHAKNRELFGEMKRCWRLNRKQKAENRRLKELGKAYRLEKVTHVWNALKTSIGSPSLRQSLDYAKVYLAERCPKSHLRRLTENESLPQKIDGPSELLENYIRETTEEPPVVPGIYYYATVFPYYKWLFDIKGSEARKDFYLNIANFFLKHPEMCPIKKIAKAVGTRNFLHLR